MLSIVSTPIGNLEDISLRALRVLREADVVIAEDTRHTGLLLKHFEIPHKPMLALYDEVESERMSDFLALVSSEQKVVLVSDAGTPLISDPGYKFVREAISKGVLVDHVPGPTAAITALVLSGLPPDKFLFLGYPPEKDSHQKVLLQSVREAGELLSSTVIFYLSPHKTNRFFGNMDAIFGNVEIVVARELTKVHQEVWRGSLALAAARYAQAKGEIVILFRNGI